MMFFIVYTMQTAGMWHAIYSDAVFMKIVFENWVIDMKTKNVHLFCSQFQSQRQQILPW